MVWKVAAKFRNRKKKELKCKEMSASRVKFVSSGQNTPHMWDNIEITDVFSLKA